MMTPAPDRRLGMFKHIHGDVLHFPRVGRGGPEPRPCELPQGHLRCGICREGYRVGDTMPIKATRSPPNERVMGSLLRSRVSSAREGFRCVSCSFILEYRA